MSFFKKLGSILGKEITDDLAEEMEKELDEFKKMLDKNKFLENIPNLELESYELPITVAGASVTGNFKTKIEHKKVLGMFLTHRVASGAVDANRNALISVKIDRKYVFCQGLFHYTLLEKTDQLTIYEVAWRTDVDIDTSEVEVMYTDGSTVVVPYSLYVHFIMQK